MIKGGVLVDTSVLISFFRGGHYANDVTELLKNDRLVTSGLIIAELLQGVKDAEEQKSLSELLGAVNPLELSTPVWIKAGILASSLRKKGVNLPLTDIAIATLAQEHSLEILTADKHFELIPGVKFYKR